MVLLDPFSAASRPMPDLSTPSRPLPFAATLLGPIDLNTASSSSSAHSSLSSSSSHIVSSNHTQPRQAHLPKPRKHDHGIPSIFPSSPYGNARHGSVSSFNGYEVESDFTRNHPVGSDEWMQARVAQCVDSATGKLDLGGVGLEQLSNKISDLRNLVTLTDIRSPSASPGISCRPMSPSLLSPVIERAKSEHRPMGRTTSLPVTSSASFFANVQDTSSNTHTINSPLLAPPNIEKRSSSALARRTISRSKTNFVNTFQSPQTAAQMNIELLLNGNRLTKLPSALFEIPNLTLLSLRGNQLTSLPAAIGQLRHLKELNISNNKITHLPSTFLDISLDLFNAHPNPWLPRPENKTSARFLSPLVSHSSGPVPRLRDLCIQLLISPQGSNDLPPFISHFDWASTPGQSALLSASALHERVPQLTENDLGRIIQILKSADFQFSQSGPKTTYQNSVDRYPATSKVAPPDDASDNPYFSACPSPRHMIIDDFAPISTLRPSKRLFLHPAEERFEWTQVVRNDPEQFPIKWMGCSPGCLAFLEQDEDDEWGIEEEDEE